MIPLFLWILAAATIQVKPATFEITNSTNSTIANSTNSTANSTNSTIANSTNSTANSTNSTIAPTPGPIGIPHVGKNGSMNGSRFGSLAAKDGKGFLGPIGGIIGLIFSNFLQGIDSALTGNINPFSYDAIPIYGVNGVAARPRIPHIGAPPFKSKLYRGDQELSEPTDQMSGENTTGVRKTVTNITSKVSTF